MNAELIEAIRELGKTSPWDIAGVVIGIIGTLLTLVVLYYNHKSIQLTQKTMQQAIGLQLYEKRLELYNAITDENAFSTAAPISLKIVYTENIYQLYSDIVELCKRRWDKMWDYALTFRVIGWENKGHGNICPELYKAYIEHIDRELQLRREGNPTEYTNIQQIYSLKKHKEDTSELHEEICKKYAQLEEKMRTILNQSIKV